MTYEMNRNSIAVIQHNIKCFVYKVDKCALKMLSFSLDLDISLKSSSQTGFFGLFRLDTRLFVAQIYKETNEELLMLSEIQINDEAIEIARLTNKHPLLTTCLGEVLPGVSQAYPSITKSLTNILDVSCGPGGWMLECAQTYRNAHIVGVDTRKAMVRCAANRSKIFPNICVFHIGSYTDFARFQNASFDIISFQCVNLLLGYQQWIHLLKECKRMLRKGGCIRLTEFERARSNSPALNKWNELSWQMEDMMQHFSYSLQDQGWLYELEPLVAAHFGETFLLPHLINFSYGAPIHKEWTHDLLLQARQDLPFMTHHHLIEQEQIVSFLKKMQLDFALPNFHAIQYGMTIWGRKN